MLKNFGNKLQGGQPRSLVVVRPATVGGFISGAKELIINHARLIAPKIIYILALIVGVVVGLSQAIFKISVNVIKSPFTSPSKKLIGDDDGDGVVGGKPSSSSEKSSLELKEVDDLRPRHLFVEPYDGLVDEQLGTEMRTPDDLVGSGTVENILVPVQKQAETSPASQKEAAPIQAAPEKESEKISEATEPSAVLLPSPAVEETSEESQAIKHLKPTQEPEGAEKVVSPPAESIAPIPLVGNEEMTSAHRAIAEAMTPQPVPPLGKPQIISPEAISPMDRLTAVEVEDDALIGTSARRSDGKVGMPEPEQQSFTAPETPELDFKSTVPPPAFEEPSYTLEDVPVSAPISTVVAAAPAAPIQQDTEPALPKHKPTPVGEHIAPAAVIQEEHKATRKKNRGPLRGPLHKAAKEIRKAFR